MTINKILLWTNIVRTRAMINLNNLIVEKIVIINIKRFILRLQTKPYNDLRDINGRINQHSLYRFTLVSFIG